MLNKYVSRELRGFLKLLYIFNWRYIARDKNDELYIYQLCPIKGEDQWNSVDKIMTSLESLYNFIDIDAVFKFIRWEDEEPFCIEDYIE